ncbi:TPA: hypothetical protein N1S95_004548 [Salmonella enterica subsp. enterica serovar Typhi]|nr:hypothetical protein [Salmonella enterica subsp. enterica serovar Typhi]
MNKKLIILFFIIVISVGGFSIISNLNDKKDTEASRKNDNSSPQFKTKNVVFEGKTEGYDSLQDLESQSPIIVKGVKEDEKRAEIFRSSADDSVIDGFTESTFKISEVHKNEQNDENIKEGSRISISEGAFYDDKTDTTYRTNGYENMISGSEYLLFLIPTEENLYAPKSVIYGKVPLNNDDLEVYVDSDDDNNYAEISEVSELFDEVRESYNE